MKRQPCLAAFALTVVLASACTDTGSGLPSSGAATRDDDCVGDGDCAADDIFLSSDEVATILAQGVHEARARGVDATIAVVDRVGNVLGVFRMGDKRERFTLIASDFTDTDGIIDEVKDQFFPISAGLDGLKLPEPDATGGGTLGGANLDQLAAISKAITGAYLSTEGMAFTSRTANQIVQDHFNPGEDFQPGGPLFGVQFSQLACSDFMQAANAVPFDTPVTAVSPGPHHAPLGLAADPGGIPLYENGSLVGGLGVMADDVYGIDPFIGDTDFDLDESIAVAAAFGFEAPVDRRATVTVEGKVFRYTDVTVDDLASDPLTASALETIPAEEGRLIAVRGYTDGELRDGTAFGAPGSGIRADDGTFPDALDAFVFVDAANAPRYAPRAATDTDFAGGSPLTAAETEVILENALATANGARAQIRQPLGTTARVTIAVVDTRGEILGMIRSRDAPMFGADVALQKARTAAFFSSSDAAEFLTSPPLTEGEFFDPSDGFPRTFYLRPSVTPGLVRPVGVDVGGYVDDLVTFFEMPNVLDGSVAFSDRAGGNLSRPFYPDGINGNPPGPLSKPPGEWSVFSTGLQLDVSYNAIAQHALFAGTGEEDGSVPAATAASFPPLSGPNCAGKSLNVINIPAAPEIPSTNRRLANGLQIFPGSVPIYRGRQLVGAIGVSGDGVDQDDLIALGGVHAAGIELGGALGNAPPDMRADRLEPQGVRLRYAQCPQAPDVDSTRDNICDGF